VRDGVGQDLGPEDSQVIVPEEGACGALHVDGRFGAVHERRHLAGESALRVPGPRLLPHVGLQRFDLLAWQEGEDLQVVDDVRVLGVQPELEELVRAQHVGSEPHRPALGLPELRAV